LHQFGKVQFIVYDQNSSFHGWWDSLGVSEAQCHQGEILATNG
jgi:hypothetical protein